ncbi:hypothetical protein GIY21_00785 [Xanthomonas sontii]|uniref:Uncharacterized protein n=1 Tax=Xanthomonas sontii TaxID=2650745 RepID=A0A6N7Q302_9XANT|nr:hypothetical protein [Xanthomonas sontii]MRG98822.1 hypothetical protein [Xanthomonas sontii]MRH73387.1 hypothetical protein [Xanthomonas sontii]
MAETSKPLSTIGTHKGKQYQIFLLRSPEGSLRLAQVWVPTLPLPDVGDQTFDQPQDAFDAGHAIARKLIDGQ